MTIQLREHIFLSLIIVVSRVALQWAGIRFDLSLDWMWLSDPADLRDRLFETLYYFHAFPPGMSLMTGILLKLGGSHAAALALATFWALGLVIANSLFHLSRVSGLSTRVGLGVAVAFTLLPQSIYFEHLYLYEYPVAALLCLAAVLFYKGVRGQSFWAWLGFFGACSAIGLTRSTFHLVWFGAMVGLGVWFTERHARRRLLVAACGPAALLLALYVKNFALFGAFDAFTFGSASQILVATRHLPSEVRDAWIKEGKLSPFAAVSVYAGPREYLPFFETSEKSEWPPQLNLLERPSVNAANYNHWFFLEVNRKRRADAVYSVRARPLDYAATVLEGSRDMFTPSTEWHPFDKTDESPHYQHRQVLGRYEAFYNRVVHGFPVAPIGLYAFLPLVVVWTLWRARSLTREGDADATARGALLFFCLFHIGFVVAASSLFTFSLETARYRYQIESMIWLITALCLVSFFHHARRAATSRLASPGPEARLTPVTSRFDSAQVRRYYDRHTRGFVAFGEGGRVGAIHRAVWGPGVGDRRGAFHFVEDQIAGLIRRLPGGSNTPSTLSLPSLDSARDGPEVVEGPKGRRLDVVDLGCGVGASLRYLAERLPMRGTGITVSPVQAQLAARLISDAGLSDRVVCVEGDYCDLPGGLGPADLAYAIESFVHAPDPARFFAQCHQLVRPGGVLAICDDFRGTPGGPAAARTLEQFREGWHINSLLEPDELRALARAAGFEHTSTLDLSPYLELRRTRDRVIGALLSLLGWLPTVRQRLDHLLGGRALQTGLERGWIRYELVVFRRL